MKINVKTDPETLFLLHRIIRDRCQELATDRVRRSGKSMRIELFSQLSQRCLNYSCNPNGKQISLTLKYHLANLLYEVLCSAGNFGVYEANKIEMLKNELHLKLL